MSRSGTGGVRGIRKSLEHLEGDLLSLPSRLCLAGCLVGKSGDVPRLAMMWGFCAGLLSPGDKLDLLTDLIWHSLPLKNAGKRGQEVKERDK